MGAAALLSSCNTLTKTARTADTYSNLQSATVVDIVPATEQRITHTLHPDYSLIRGGENNVKQAAEHEALLKYGNADVLLEPQYIIQRERMLFGSKITAITVSGRPAYYTNYRSLHDSVWCNPVFRGVYQPKALPMASRGKLPFVKKGGMTSRAEAPRVAPYRTKGFHTYLTPFIGYGAYDCRHAYKEGTALGAFLTLGYQFGPYLYLGAGVGVNGMNGGSVYYDDDHTKLRGTYIPLYGDLRINFSKKRNTPFIEAKLGYGAGGTTDAVGGGFFGGAAVGYSFGDFDIAFQFLSHNHYYSYERYSERWVGYYDERYVYSYWEGWHWESYWNERLEGYWEHESDYIDFLQFGLSFSFRF